jgi:hypothetical protein
MGQGSPEQGKVNKLLVDNFVALLAAFSPAERQAVFKAIMAMPGFPGKEKPSTPPMMNDALRGNLDERPAGPSLSSDAIAFAVRLEWVYKRSGNGGYDWRTANNAAHRFLRKHPGADLGRLFLFAEESEYRPMIKGKLPVYPGMFDELWSYMVHMGC